MSRRNILPLYIIVQVIFVLVMLIVLAGAQALGASLTLSQVLSVFGGAVLVEMLVFGCIWGYVALSQDSKHAGRYPKHGRRFIEPGIANRGDE